MTSFLPKICQFLNTGTKQRISLQVRACSNVNKIIAGNNSFSGIKEICQMLFLLSDNQTT